MLTSPWPPRADWLLGPAPSSREADLLRERSLGQLGRQRALLWCRERLNFAKEGSSPVRSYGLKGTLYLSQSGWLLLSVPNSLIQGAFDALHELGAEPPAGREGGGPYKAHVSVLRAEEVEVLGADNVSERGHTFSYTLGPLKVVDLPEDPDYARVWFIEVQSPELQKLRKSYGLEALPAKKGVPMPFHITVAYQRRKVLRAGPTSKLASQAAGRLCSLLS